MSFVGTLKTYVSQTWLLDTLVRLVFEVFEQSLRDNMWSRRLCRVVKRKSCKTYWILLGQLTTHVSFEVTVPSTLIVINWAAERSFTSVNMLIHIGERPFTIVLVCIFTVLYCCFGVINDNNNLVNSSRACDQTRRRNATARAFGIAHIYQIWRAWPNCHVICGEHW